MFAVDEDDVNYLVLLLQEHFAHLLKVYPHDQSHLIRVYPQVISSVAAAEMGDVCCSRRDVLW